MDISNVQIEAGCSIITAVGDSMHRDPAIPGRFMSALGEAGIRQLTMAQNLGARNISTVVKAADSERALRTVHSAFLSHQVVSVGIIGLSYVGAKLHQRTYRRLVAVPASEHHRRLA